MWLLSKLPVFQAVNTWCPNFRTLTVTRNKKDFSESSLPVYTPAELLELLSSLED